MNIDTVLSSSFFYALLMGASIGGVAAYIGSLMLTRRTTLMAGALGHLALPGVAIALKYGFDVSFGAIGILLVGIILIWLLEKRTKLPTEALTAIVFTSSVATAFLFLPEGKTVPALLGDVSHLTLLPCLLTIIISGVILYIAYYIFNRMILITISRDIAQTYGYAVSWYNVIYLACIALIVGLGVRIVGGLMTAALIAIPAGTSRNVSSSMTQYALLSMVFGALSSVVGVIIAHFFVIPVGSAIILSSTVFFLISLLIPRSR